METYGLFHDDNKTPMYIGVFEGGDRGNQGKPYLTYNFSKVSTRY